MESSEAAVWRLQLREGRKQKPEEPACAGGEVGRDDRRQTQRAALGVTGVEGRSAAHSDRQAFPMLTDFPGSQWEMVMAQLT